MDAFCFSMNRRGLIDRRPLESQSTYTDENRRGIPLFFLIITASQSPGGVIIIAFSVHLN